MNQSQLNRAVAGATGENVSTIKSLGFSLVEPMFHLLPAETLLVQYRQQRRGRRRKVRREPATA